MTPLWRWTRAAIAALAITTIAPAMSTAPACATEACCKRCKSGKPCGDGCIAADKVCNKPAGCACQG